ncbi:hypothetical protein KM043_011372 [Ampulex compressa]|nr:hypothetical protein KM043_011372 [Ampulex compressa]
MWSTIIYSYTFVLLWVLDFVMFCTATLLMIAHNTQLNELKKCILSKNVHVESPNVTECEIQRAENAWSIIEAKTSCRWDRYNSIMTELKKNVCETKQEAKLLQNQVQNLTFRREALKNEVLKLRV